MGGDKAVAVHFHRHHGRLVADLHAQALGASKVGVDQCLAAAHEKCVGARDVQGARQRRLEMHAVATHPVAAIGRRADHQARQVFVGQAPGDLEQVLPEFLLRVGVDQHVLGCVMHAAQVARVLRVSTAPGARRRFEQQHAGAGLARHQRCA